jgi:hypothetical protein
VQILLLDQIVDILLTIIIYYAVINLRGVSTNKTIIYLIAMQTYKELNTMVAAGHPTCILHSACNII